MRLGPPCFPFNENEKVFLSIISLFSKAKLKHQFFFLRRRLLRWPHSPSDEDKNLMALFSSGYYVSKFIKCFHPAQTFQNTMYCCFTFLKIFLSNAFIVSKLIFREFLQKGGGGTWVYCHFVLDLSWSAVSKCAPRKFWG